MMALDTAEEGRIGFDGPEGRGAIVFDRLRLPQAEAAWFTPAFWGDRAQPVAAGGRGGAWYIDAPVGPCVLRLYRRGGLMARLSEDRYLWQGESRARSVAEFRLTRAMLSAGVPVPVPLAAYYAVDGGSYRAALLMCRLQNVQTLAERALAGTAPWAAAGRLVAHAHRAGLDHADLNADNLLFAGERGWVIDLDRGLRRTLGDGWRARNLRRLQRSLLKRCAALGTERIQRGFSTLLFAYEETFDDD